MKSARFGLALIVLLSGFSGPTAYAATEDDKIVAADTGPGDLFGFSVAVSGTTAVVGAQLDDDAGTNSGSAYVFDCSSFPCVQVSKLTASDAAGGDTFGVSVAVSGTTVVVGARHDADAGDASGSAYYFDLATCGAACTETSKLTASDATRASFFGQSVGVSGTTAVVGVFNSETAYYFELSTCGATCTETGKLTASDGVAGDHFGIGVAISGTVVVVGAPLDNDAATDSGSAYYFDLSTCGVACTETGKLTASDAAARDQFGESVAVSGTIAVVGARNVLSGNQAGSAYYFDLSACGAACTETGKLTASDAAEGDHFGLPVAISGTTAVAGAAGDDGLDDGTGDGSGAAYYFDLATCGVACTEKGKLTASDAGFGLALGTGVAVSETTAVVGAPSDNVVGFGSAYVYLVIPQLYCFSFANFCDGIEITDVLPDKTVVGTWRNTNCAGATAPMLGGYSGKDVSPRLSWLGSSPTPILGNLTFTLNVEAKTFDLWLHDRVFNLTQVQNDQPYTVAPEACSFGPEKEGFPASTGVGE